jgi:alkylhydroperoxidase/carboxymuconolactone decarboxylase family protein YurZ
LFELLFVLAFAAQKERVRIARPAAQKIGKEEESIGILSFG